MRNDVMQHYMQRYAAALAEQTAAKVTTAYRHAVVIPMFDEPTNCLAQVFKHHQRQDTLAIAVINAPAGAPASRLASTRLLLTQCRESSPVDVLPVDCVTHPLDPKSGVGLARKIGTDIAVALYLQKKLDSPWLYQTDADAILPSDYFDRQLPDNGAVVFGHTHHSDDATLAYAAHLYDLHMKYYTTGLSAAGSRFAYPTLGSTVAVHAHSYACVRGYPKRNAAEDFYLLNKVAKVHGITHLPDVEIKLQARLSARVPFGTGPALCAIHAGLQSDPSGNSYLSYNFASFELLATTLDFLDNFAEQPPRAVAPEAVETLLAILRFDRVRNAIGTKYASPERRRQVIHEWFDAGKTLRFIHEARRYYPDAPLLETVLALPESLKLRL